MYHNLHGCAVSRAEPALYRGTGQLDAKDAVATGNLFHQERDLVEEQRVEGLERVLAPEVGAEHGLAHFLVVVHRPHLRDGVAVQPREECLDHGKLGRHVSAPASAGVGWGGVRGVTRTFPKGWASARLQKGST